MALDLMRIFDERGSGASECDPSCEDLRVYEAWARLRRVLGGKDA